MAQYIRPKVTGARVFFTLCLAARGSDLLVAEIAALRRAVAQTQRERPFGIAAWVVLPDHLHCVWQMPVGDREFGVRWGAIKGRFSHGLTAQVRSQSKIRKGEKGIWQRRYWEHHIREDADFEAHVRYCWGNPVRHGLVRRPLDWPYSSIHRDVRLGLVPPEWSGATADRVFGEPGDNRCST